MANSSDNPQRLPPGRLAGIDFGTVRVGIAISDPSQTLASPLTVYTRRGDDLDAEFFQALVQRESIVGLVVGLPVHMSGDESQKSRQVRQFGTWLARVTSLPVAYVDERYSTAAASRLLRGNRLSPTKQKSLRDKVAAQIILTTYLESGGSGGSPLPL